MRTTSLIALILLISSCSFRPLYGDADGDAQLFAKLRSIEVPKIQRKGAHSQLEGQILKNHLVDMLNPTDLDVDSKYVLKIDLSTHRMATVTKETGAYGRFNLKISANYKLVELAKNQVIDEGLVYVMGSFESSSAQFTTYSLEDKTSSNLLKNLAQDIVRKVSMNLL